MRHARREASAGAWRTGADSLPRGVAGLQRARPVGCDPPLPAGVVARWARGARFWGHLFSLCYVLGLRTTSTTPSPTQSCIFAVAEGFLGGSRQWVGRLHEALRVVGLDGSRGERLGTRVQARDGALYARKRVDLSMHGERPLVVALRFLLGGMEVPSMRCMYSSRLWMAT